MRHFSKSLWAMLLALPLVWLISVGSVAAATLTGTIVGTVVDADGSPLPGVTVVMQSESLIRERAVLTNSSGEYFAPGLDPGDYTVTAKLAGFQSVRQSTQVVVDQTTRVDFKLATGDLTETVTVVSTKPVVDKSTTEGSVNLTKDFTETVPVGRTYQSLVQLAPGVVASSDGNPNILGGTQNANAYAIDGVNITDPVTGTFGSNFNYDAIEVVDVKLTGVSAEYGGFQGALTNIITRAGGNDFTGSLRDQVGSPSFEKAYTSQGLSEFAADRPSPCAPGDTSPNCFTYSRPSIPAAASKALTNTLLGAFGGPIVRDNAWFFLSYRRSDRVDVGQLETGVTYPDTFQGDTSSLKLTYQVANDHKLQYTYFEDPANTSRCYNGLFLRGDDAAGCWDTAFIDYQKQGGYSWTGSWNALWGNHVFMDVKATHWQNGFLISDYPGSTPFFDANLIFESPNGLGSGVAAGNAPFWDISTLTGFDARVFSSDPQTRKRDEYEAKVTSYFSSDNLGSNTLTVGANYQEQTRIGASIISGNALFYGAGWVNPPQSGGDPYDPNNRIWDTWYDFAEPGTGANQTKTTVLFVQDDWQINNHLTLNLGIRFENNDNTNDVGETVVKQTGFAPRLGAAYDVTGEGKHLVKATASRYLDTIELTTLDFFTRAAGGQSAYDVYKNRSEMGVQYPGRPVIPGPGEDCTDYPGMPCWELQASIRPDVDTNTYASDLKPQSIDEFTLGYEYSVTPTLGLQFKAINRKWNDVVGRTLSYDYSGPDGINGTADDSPRTLLFLDNRDYIKRKYNAAQIQVEKRFSDNWQLLANYVWQKAEGTDSSRSTDQGFADFGLYPGVPQTMTNRYGQLPWSVTHTFKAYGSYNVPLKSKRHGLNVGAALNYRTGDHYSAVDTSQAFVVDTGIDLVQDCPLGTPSGSTCPGPDGMLGTPDDTSTVTDQTAQINVYDSERGSFESPSRWALDLSLAWKFNFSKKVFFETRFEVFNVTNEQRPVSYSTSFFQNVTSQSRARSNYLFGYPTGFGNLQDPRTYNVIFSIVF